MDEDKNYFWITKLANGTSKIGLNDAAMDEFGTINFIDFPEVNSALTTGGSFISIEAEKAVTDLVSPITGKVVEINPTLTSNTDDLNLKEATSRWILTVK